MDHNNNDSPISFDNRNEALVKCVFTLLGIGFLLPWNAFISASAYFEGRISDCGSNLESHLQAQSNRLHAGKPSTGKENNFMLWFGLLYNISGVCSIAIMLLSQKRRERKHQTETLSAINYDDSDAIAPEHGQIEHIEQSNTGARHPQWKTVMTALSCFLLAMLITTFLVLLPSTLISPYSFQIISLVSASICGIAGAFISTGIVAFASDFPPTLGIQPFISGQAVGGVVISFLNLIMFGMEENGAHTYWEEHCQNDSSRLNHVSDIDTMIYTNGQSETEGSEYKTNLFTLSETSLDLQSCGPYHVDWGAFTYFLVGTIFIAICMGLYIYLDQSPVTRNYRELRRVDTQIGDGQQINSDNGGEESRVIGVMEDAAVRGRLQDAEIDEIDLVAQNSLIEPLLPLNIENDDLPSASDGIRSESEAEGMTSQVWKLVQRPAISIFVTFFITLSIFPSWITKLESVQECQDQRSRFHNDLFVPAFIALFNLFDFLGRASSGLFGVNQASQAKLSRLLSIASYARVVFLPIFLLCKASGSAFVPPINVFYNDLFPIFFTCLFAFSNGFVSTLSFVQAAVATPAKEDMVKVASTILNFAVGLGLLSGSLFSFAFNYVGSKR